MAQAVFTGPVIALGPVAGAPRGGPPIEYSDEIGPSLLWNGVGLPLAGSATGSKDQKGPGSLRALLASPNFPFLNQILATGGASVTTAGHANSGTAFPLVTAFAAGITAGCPVITPTGLQVGVGLDTGWSSGTAASGSSTITAIPATDIWRFYPGQWISIGGAGAGGAVLFARVTAIASGTSITISTPALTSQSTAAIGNVAGNPNSYAWAPIAYSALQAAGSGLFVNPDCGGARGVGVTGVAGGSGGNVTITGVDIFGQVTSEIIAAAAGAATTYGVKTYKVILSAVPAFTDANNYTVVTSDLIGCPLVQVNDGYPFTVWSNGAAYTTAVFQFADLTNPATQTTKDPRGAVQLSAKGPVNGGGGTGPNGSLRFTLMQQLNPAQAFLASPTNYQVLYGVTPA
jgi:hypothetical protein